MAYLGSCHFRTVTYVNYNEINMKPRISLSFTVLILNINTCCITVHVNDAGAEEAFYVHRNERI